MLESIIDRPSIFENDAMTKDELDELAYAFELLPHDDVRGTGCIQAVVMPSATKSLYKLISSMEHPGFSTFFQQIIDRASMFGTLPPIVGCRRGRKLEFL